MASSAAHIRIVLTVRSPEGRCRSAAPCFDPLVFNPAYDSGDHLHTSDAGYQAMADAIDLGLLLRP
jgi:lysophospholipase L1-like esterase